MKMSKGLKDKNPLPKQTVVVSVQDYTTYQKV
jgi:hypothetical protein